MFFYLNFYFFFLLGVLILNSMDEDFDDFKFAGSKSSDSSQFILFEQSENEDFKVLEFYLDDFNQKKSEQEK